ncbi:hypothetical protein SLNWT_0578 [Streptomyces albus]|uniref:Uncharacterized protein n=1 Tax=Streptomyces albus (strain ATCC 21838 / DSM 41398 / FERM P-419 / JCM 4703 / NBRC 107858) TaxID=1081613 RepID=A0A0B5EHT3_STRA4|nr:hypothetical protein SLNWT_0578 [Streptomyces albus]AOU75266.1 hypothetical protein SLNHY_0575 [Streptomyces albus]AYN31071.1 hypothetical protein DUI70_0568 [Streptomyces albus]
MPLHSEADSSLPITLGYSAHFVPEAGGGAILLLGALRIGRGTQG